MEIPKATEPPPQNQAKSGGMVRGAAVGAVSGAAVGKIRGCRWEDHRQLEKRWR